MNIAIITGASRGLGLQLVKEFATKEWEVVGTGRSPQPKDFPTEHATYQQFDAGQAEACEQFVQAIQSQYQDARICLVNNAGGYAGGKITDNAASDYENQMRSNYFSGVYMTKAVVKNFAHARIINVISRSALVINPNDSAYGPSKAAASHFFQVLQKELDPAAYQITNLYPSVIATSGPNPNAIDPSDLAALVLQLAESQTTYYPADITLLPNKLSD